MNLHQVHSTWCVRAETDPGIVMLAVAGKSSLLFMVFLLSSCKIDSLFNKSASINIGTLDQVDYDQIRLVIKAHGSDEQVVDETYDKGTNTLHQKLAIGKYDFALDYMKGGDKRVSTSYCKDSESMKSQTHSLEAGENDIQIVVCQVSGQAHYVPLFPGEESFQEHENQVTMEGAITNLGGRVRVRHARSSQRFKDFGVYYVYPTSYFQNRTYALRIIDKTAIGIPEIKLELTTVHGITQRQDFKSAVRFFYTGQKMIFDYLVYDFWKEVPASEAEHFPKISSDPNLKTYHYTYSFSNDRAQGRLIKGDVVEFELTFIFDKPMGDNGADWYYSRAGMIRLGEPGVIPWYIPNLQQTNVPAQLKSVALPEEFKSGGELSLSVNASERDDLMIQQMSPNIAPVNTQDFVEGRRLFNTDFITGQHHDKSNEVFHEVKQLAGPNYNESSCRACHVNNGRSGPQEGAQIHNVVAKLDRGDAVDEQVHTRATDGSAQSQVQASFRTVDRDGVQLFEALYDINPKPSEEILVRRPLPLIAMGLIEAIDEADIIDWSKQQTGGISGRPNFVKDLKTGEMKLGRFGWGAESASLRDQVARAFYQDMGVTSSLVPGHQGEVEIDDEKIRKLVSFLRNTGVPARNMVYSSEAEKASIQRGESLFNDLTCSVCHRVNYTTGDTHPFAVLRKQNIKLYSDLLLHDMGADLSRVELRTPPLLGIGWAVNNGQSSFLHDGRARTLEEAILWHGGEAEGAQGNFKGLDQGKKQDLINFLKSL